MQFEHKTSENTGNWKSNSLNPKNVLREKVDMVYHFFCSFKNINNVPHATLKKHNCTYSKILFLKNILTNMNIYIYAIPIEV